ncbi:MAG: VIT1/CCC1 transporter family protein [Candidatus Dormibacteria bacterium]
MDARTSAEPPPGGPLTDLSQTAREAAEHIDVTRARVARRSRVREVIFGTQDGLLTTLGLVSGVGGATSDRYSVLVAGVAGSLAGMIAMGAGAYISSKSQLEVHQAEIAREEGELQRNPEREKEELVHLFQEQGLPEEDARVVADRIASRPGAMLTAMTQMELGLALDASEPRKEGAVMAGAFLVGAIVPITPWFVASTSTAIRFGGLHFSNAFFYSLVATMVALFVMGIGKASLGHTRYLRGGLEVVVIGFVAAVVSYLLGQVFPHLVGSRISPT